jgi:hypothetical protein
MAGLALEKAACVDRVPANHRRVLPAGLTVWPAKVVAAFPFLQLMISFQRIFARLLKSLGSGWPARKPFPAASAGNGWSQWAKIKIHFPSLIFFFAREEQTCPGWSANIL